MSTDRAQIRVAAHAITHMSRTQMQNLIMEMGGPAAKRLLEEMKKMEKLILTQDGGLGRYIEGDRYYHSIDGKVFVCHGVDLRAPGYILMRNEETGDFTNTRRGTHGKAFMPVTE